MSGPPPCGPSGTCVSFDFGSKDEAPCPVADAAEAMAAGRFIWLDLDLDDADALTTLRSLDWVHEELIQEALHGEPTTQFARFEKYLHLSLCGCRIDDHRFDLNRVDLFLGERFLLTLHHGPVPFMEKVRREYRADFVRFAQSPSFLLYEVWDHLTEHYVAVQKHFEDRVEALQSELIHEIDDRVFQRVSEVGGQLLNFRKVLLPSRAALNELSTRKSPFVSEATQPFLANMAGTLDRVLQDALVDREILAQSLNLHMSMVAHRTNRVMTKLTLVSIVFLPLTFLCGVYGMNFAVLPELQWELGYLYFWGAVGVIVLVALRVLKRLGLR